jgi:hypothetical protein
MKPSITLAQQAKTEKYLDGRINVDGRILSRRDFLLWLIQQGGKLSIRRWKRWDAVDKVNAEIERAGRNVPWGNPDHPDTKAYYRLKEKLENSINKEELVVRIPDDRFWSMTKTDAEFFIERGGEKGANP